MVRITTEGQSIYCQSCQTRRGLHRVKLQRRGSEAVMYLCDDCIKYVADMMGGDAGCEEDTNGHLHRFDRA